MKAAGLSITLQISVLNLMANPVCSGRTVSENPIILKPIVINFLNLISDRRPNKQKTTINGLKTDDSLGKKNNNKVLQEREYNHCAFYLYLC